MGLKVKNPLDETLGERLSIRFGLGTLLESAFLTVGLSMLFGIVLGIIFSAIIN